jgi:hypothetical protein
MKIRSGAAADPVDVAVRFVDCINRRRVDGLVALMSDGHSLEVFAEKPVVGRDRNAAAWRAYMDAFPRYRIHPRRIEVDGGVVAILGHTTGSHRRLPDVEEREITLIWLAEVRHGKVERWRLIDDSPAHRKRYALDGP